MTPLDLHSREFLENPAPTLAWLREHDPVHRSHPAAGAAGVHTGRGHRDPAFPPPQPADHHPRLALEDVDIRGSVVPTGSTVRVALGAANRDPARWPDPERFDITRPESVSLGFGQGIHYCIGAPLARMQTTVALQRLIERCPHLALTDDTVRHDPRRMDRYETIGVTLDH